MAAETSVMQFESNFQQIFKVDDSVGLVFSDSMMICSPFRVTRPLTGMHNSLYKSSNNIIYACHFYYDCRLAAEFLGEDFPYSRTRESFFLVYDSTKTFTVLDGPRSIIISSFNLEGNPEVVQFCGHPHNLGEIGILTKTSILRIQIQIDRYNLIDTIPINSAAHISAIFPYMNGYLLQTPNSIQLLENDHLIEFKSVPHLSRIIIDDIHIAMICSTKKNNVFKISFLQGDDAFGISSTKPALMDVCDDYFISLHNEITLNFTRISNMSHRTSVQLTQAIKNPFAINAGINSTMDAIVVVAFADTYGVLVTVPFTELGDTPRTYK